MSDSWGELIRARTVGGVDRSGRSSWRGSWRAVIAAVALLVVGLIGAEPSAAGTYPMRNCDVPGYPSAPMGPWRSVPGGNVALVDRCSTSGGFSFALPATRNMPNNGKASLELRPPANHQTIIESVRVWSSSRLTGPVGFLGAYIRAVSDLGVVWSKDLGGGLDQPVEARIPEGAWGAQLVLTCSTGDRPSSARATVADECLVDGPVPLEIHGIEATLLVKMSPRLARPWVEPWSATHLSLRFAASTMWPPISSPGWRGSRLSSAGRWSLLRI